MTAIDYVLSDSHKVLHVLQSFTFMGETLHAFLCGKQVDLENWVRKQREEIVALVANTPLLWPKPLIPWLQGFLIKYGSHLQPNKFLVNVRYACIFIKNT